MAINLAEVISQELPADSRDSLIITEVMLKPQGAYQWGYVELTNRSAADIDLSDYFLQTSNSTALGGISTMNSRWKLSLNGWLGAGKTYLIVSSQINNAVDAWGKARFPNGYVNIYAVQMADRVVGNSDQTFDEPGSRLHSSIRIALIFRNRETGDSAIVDRFGWTNNNQYIDGTGNFTQFIAGIVTQNDPTQAFTWVRKHRVKKGNTDFINSKGDDLRTSEWMPLDNSRLDNFAIPYTTIGNHGSSNALELSSENATLNRSSNIITFNYGVRRDSVIRLFNISQNVAWKLKIGSDTAQYFLQNDDSIFFYVFGDSITEYKFSVNIIPRKSSFSSV